MTLSEAKALKRGDMIYHKYLQNADGTAMRYRVNGKIRTWKTRPNEVQVPLKRGLYEYGHLTEENLGLFTN